MKAKVLYISKSGRSATLSVDQKFGPIVNRVTGFAGLPENHDLKVGSELDIPAAKVSVEERATPEHTDDNGVYFPAGTMNHLVFS